MVASQKYDLSLQLFQVGDVRCMKWVKCPFIYCSKRFSGSCCGHAEPQILHQRNVKLNAYSTIIFPHSTNHIIDLRYCRRGFLINSLISCVLFVHQYNTNYRSSVNVKASCVYQVSDFPSSCYCFLEALL